MFQARLSCLQLQAAVSEEPFIHAAFEFLKEAAITKL